MANETLQQILSAQNTYIQNGETARTRAEGKLDTALTALSSLAAYRYPVYQNIVTQTALDDDYTAICTANDGYSDRSAIGLSVLMRAGDTLSDHGYLLYVNGERAQGESFTCPSESGVALVHFWLFAHDTLEFVTLSDETSLCVVEYVEKNGVSVTGTVTNRNWYIYADRAVYNRGAIPMMSVPSNTNSTMSITCNRVIEIYGRETEGGITNGSYSPINIPCQTLIHHCKDITGKFNSTNTGSIVTKTMYFPDAESVSGTKNFALMKGDVIFDKLERITGSSTAGEVNATFKETRYVILPATVTTITGNMFANNTTVDLRCKNATIDSAFCSGAPTSLILCADWGATINLAVAAANWTAAQFIDLMTNKLRDWTAEENGGYTFADDGYQRAITIPAAKLASIPSETIEAARAKLWDVTGG